jgi:hypothetical protein
LVRGLKQGKGTYYYLNGNIYEGDWKNDKKEGFGIFIYKTTNEKYVGEWINGERWG